MRHTDIRRLAAASMMGLGAALASAQIPVAIPFQARLLSSTSQPVNNPAQPITLALYTVPAGGTAVYNETQTVPVVNGILSTAIGTVNPTGFGALSFNAPYWVGVSIGTDAEMKPRIPLAAVPYARGVADFSVTHQGLAVDAASLAQVTGGWMASSNGKIGIATLTPSAQLDVNGTVKIEGYNTLEFGAGMPGKQQDAGKIGYAAFTNNTLDIVGAGSDAGQRRIKLHAEGGATVSGPLIVTQGTSLGGNLAVTGNVNVIGNLGVGNITPQGPLHVKGEGPILLLEGADHAYIEYYPRGFYSGRKAYIGFPSAYSTTLEINNEFGGAVRVIGTFVNNSDIRYKTNVAPLDGALDSVMKLRGVTYDWRKDLPGVHLPDQRQVGFIAQDVEKVLPDLVYTEKNGEKSVAYVNMVPVLVEAIKQQQREIADLKAEIERQKR